MQQGNKKRKLKILCLHDIDSNGYLMKMSMWPMLLKVEQAVGVEHFYINSPIVDDYEKHYIQKAEEQGKKLEKIPLRKGQGWYIREEIKEYRKEYLNNNERAFDIRIQYNQLQKSLEKLREILDRKGPFDGVIGIGQGASIAALLSMKRSNIGENHASKPYCFNFVILVEPRSFIEDIQHQEFFKLAAKYLNGKDGFGDQESPNNNNIQKQSNTQATDSDFINDSTEMLSFHIYSKGNKVAEQYQQYYSKDKLTTYEFQLLEQRIKESKFEREKKYFDQDKGPKNLILPSEVSSEYIKFLNKYIHTQTKKIVFKKAELPKSLNTNQTQGQQLNTEQQNPELQMCNNNFNEYANQKAQGVFEKAKKQCRVDPSNPCVYALCKIATQKTSRKSSLSSFEGDYTKRSRLNLSQNMQPQQLCEVCCKFTNLAIQDLIYEGKKRLLPKQISRQQTMYTEQ